MGLPEEGFSDVMKSIQSAVALAVEYSIATLKFEWWYNAPKSPFYQPSPLWEEQLKDDAEILSAETVMLEQAPATLSNEERDRVLGLIEFLRQLHQELQIQGPGLGSAVNTSN